MITPDELHTFLIGFSEAYPPWKPHYHDRVAPPKYFRTEYHYYTAGRATGFITLLLILIALAKLVIILFT